MPDTPSDKASGLADNVLRALALLIEKVRRDVERLSAEQSKKHRSPKDKTPAQVAVDNARPAIGGIVKAFTSLMEASIDGDKWTAQQATECKQKLKADLDNLAKAAHAPDSTIYSTAAALVDDAQFVSLRRPPSFTKKEYR